MDRTTMSLEQHLADQADHDGKTGCVGCGEVACECETRASAWKLLVDWVTAPGTRRRVTNIAHVADPGGGKIWAVGLSAGGYVVESATQRTLGGAIRNAIMAAGLL